MNQNYENNINLFKMIIENPKNLTKLPKEYLNDADFIEIFYIILNSEIKPYIPAKTYDILKHREVIFKNKHMTKPKNKPNISLEDEINLLHNILTDPNAINLLPTNEKYNNSFLEFIYIIYGDEIENYIPYEMFEEIKNEQLMKKYHQNHNQEQENWVNEVHQKIKLLSK